MVFISVSILLIFDTEPHHITKNDIRFIYRNSPWRSLKRRLSRSVKFLLLKVVILYMKKKLLFLQQRKTERNIKYGLQRLQRLRKCLGFFWNCAYRTISVSQERLSTLSYPNCSYPHSVYSRTSAFWPTDIGLYSLRDLLLNASGDGNKVISAFTW